MKKLFLFPCLLSFICIASIGQKAAKSVYAELGGAGIASINYDMHLQKKEGGFLFRADITPIFGKGYFIPYYAGISFGYKF